MGDPGWVKVPQKAMVSNEYAVELRKKIDLQKAIEILPGDPWPYEPESTTALCVGDKEGNFVAINQTLVNSFGSGVTVPNTGGGGKALAMGMDLDVNSGALVAEVLERSLAFFEGTTSVREELSGLPAEFALYQNYPNPFNPSTTISFSLPRAEVVTLSVYSILGQEVARLIDGQPFEAGQHRISWDGSRSDGEAAASGVYLCTIKTRSWMGARRMLLLKCRFCWR